MDDIMERLRRCKSNPNPWRRPYVKDLLGEAADTIDRQREEIGRMREALKQIAYGEPDYSVYAWRHYHELARSALSDTTRERSEDAPNHPVQEDT